MDDSGLPAGFGWFLGNEPRIRILYELVNEPFLRFTVEEMAERAQVTEPRAINVLNRLVDEHFCIVADHTYRVNVASKRFLALLCVAIAVADDKDNGTRLDQFLDDCFISGRLEK